MTINGINCELAHEQTIVLMKGTDGMYYAQSAALCKANNPYTAVRRCMACMMDYEFAKKYDMYQNGELNTTDTAPRRRNEELHKCL